MMSVQETGPAWHEIVRDTLKSNAVRLVTYVPDNVLKPLINALHADDYFTTFATTREEEAGGIVAGARMAGLRGIDDLRARRDGRVQR
jgi:sulfopyruvate decarboxylase TPP-binding subunit